MSAEHLSHLLFPRSIALIGASDQAESLGRIYTQALLETDYSGEIHLVNRRRIEAYGRPCLESVGELPLGVDLAVVMTPWDGVFDVLEDLSERQCRSAVVVSVATEGGWWRPSRESQIRKLQQLSRRSGMRIVGPASQGLILAQQRLNLSLCPALPPPGAIGFVSASGAVASVIADWSAQRGIGMSALLSLGDEADVDIADALDWFAQDQATRAVLVHLEGLRDPRRFLSAARALSFRKPVVLLKARSSLLADGDSDRVLTEAVYAACFRRAGLLQVDDLEDFCAAANVDLPAWPHKGSRFAIAANGHALGALAADAVLGSGGELAQLSEASLKALKPLLPPRSKLDNPLDLGRDATAARYADAARLLAHDAGTDVVLLVHHPTAFASGREIAAALPAIDREDALVLAAFAGADQQAARRTLAERGIAAFATPESAVRAYSLNRRHYRHKASLMRTPSALPLNWRIDPTALQAAVASTSVEFPDLSYLAAAAGIELRALPLSDAQAPAVLGLHTHPQLGPYAFATGPSGVQVELLPLNRLQAAQLVEHALGERDADFRATLETQFWLLAELVLRCEAIHSLELIQPRRIAGGELAAEVRLDWRAETPRCRLAFAPPPLHPHEPVVLRDGRSFLLRPIRAEDEPELQRGFTRLSPEEVRMRFLYPLKALTHDLAARLTQLDDDREVALVLAGFDPPGRAELVAVVRASFDPARASAEFAIVIPAELAGQGLGTRLLGRIIEIARDRGMHEIYGDVLPENAAMLALARKLGFSSERREDLIRVRLALSP